MTEAVIWSTDGLPRTGAFDAWTSKMAELHLSWALSFPTDEQFEAAVRYRRLGDLTIADFRGGRFAGRRVRSGSNQDRDQLVGVSMNLVGRVACQYAGSELLVGPDQLLIWDGELAQGFDAVDPHRELTLLLPRERVPRGLAAAASRVDSSVSTAAGTGLLAIAGDQLRSIARELDNLSDAALAIACQSFFDTLDSALTPLSERPPSTARAALMVRVRHHIEDNLGDPGLCASSIATAHGISVRTLHLLFADSGTTVGRWIRERRLEACRRELARGGGHKTVTDIAFRWGFNDTAHFSRSFKQAFGVTPSSVLSQAGGTAPRA
ncbi:helix-turn-helix domain-containing protein [Nocardia sp. NPDC059246]|uniref:helix-turn-helix domain-containing protein n=1 Tax=unclassified Nocardia TaxID=2637762 RepID=UPI0036BF9948